MFLHPLMRSTDNMHVSNNTISVFVVILEKKYKMNDCETVSSFCTDGILMQFFLLST